MFGVTFAVDQWFLLLAVFVLTLTALYGLGMVLATLFLLWGREAFHLTQLVIEPVYFVSGLNFPVGRLGCIGALAIATIPFAVGLDAMRQLAFVGQPYSTGTPPPEVEALILVAMTVVFTLLARWMLRRHRADGPQPTAACRSDGSERDHARPGDPRIPAAPAAVRARALRPRPDRGSRSSRTPGELRTAAFLGWRDGGQLDRPGAVRHLLGRQADRVGAASSS